MNQRTPIRPGRTKVLVQSLAPWALGLAVALSGCAKNPEDQMDMASGGADLATASDLLGPEMVSEKKLDVQLTLSGMTLKIVVKDGAQAVMTDVWLYSVEGSSLKPFSDFVDPDSKRKSRRKMLPCQVGGAASNLSPCDSGEENGFMTDSVRESLKDGQRLSAINGTVELTLSKVPTTNLLALVAVEDQRYAGAAAIDPMGKPATVPQGVGEPRKYVARSYAKDVKPLLMKQRCEGCHGMGGPAAAFPLNTYEAVVENDFGFEEEKAKCQTMFPNDAEKRAACEKAITLVEYMIEKGAPALSPFLRRTRPDEMKSVSDEGLKWYGSGGKRFGGAGDRRMPPQNITADPMDDKATATHFDDNPADYQILFDWVAQGAPR